MYNNTKNLLLHKCAVYIVFFRFFFFIQILDSFPSHEVFDFCNLFFDQYFTSAFLTGRNKKIIVLKLFSCPPCTNNFSILWMWLEMYLPLLMINTCKWQKKIKVKKLENDWFVNWKKKNQNLFGIILISKSLHFWINFVLRGFSQFQFMPVELRHCAFFWFNSNLIDFDCTFLWNVCQKWLLLDFKKKKLVEEKRRTYNCYIYTQMVKQPDVKIANCNVSAGQTTQYLA